MTTNQSDEPPSPEEIRRGCAEVLARYDPALWRRLLAEHVPDETGHCQSCRWPTRATPMWPCNLADVAYLASRMDPPEDPQPTKATKAGAPQGSEGVPAKAGPCNTRNQPRQREVAAPKSDQKRARGDEGATDYGSGRSLPGP
jgi:hypothetical protein